jgi:hypothetical protein
VNASNCRQCQQNITYASGMDDEKPGMHHAAPD